MSCQYEHVQNIYSIAYLFTKNGTSPATNMIEFYVPMV